MRELLGKNHSVQGGFPVPPLSDCQPISCFFFNSISDRVNRKWAYVDYRGRRMSKAKFEEFKTRFYKLQGRDVSSACPTRIIKHYTAESQR